MKTLMLTVDEWSQVKASDNSEVKQLAIKLSHVDDMLSSIHRVIENLKIQLEIQEKAYIQTEHELTVKFRSLEGN